jgi:hypothetical protein
MLVSCTVIERLMGFPPFLRILRRWPDELCARVKTNMKKGNMSIFITECYGGFMLINAYNKGIRALLIWLDRPENAH